MEKTALTFLELKYCFIQQWYFLPLFLIVTVEVNYWGNFKSFRRRLKIALFSILAMCYVIMPTTILIGWETSHCVTILYDWLIDIKECQYRLMYFILRGCVFVYIMFILYFLSCTVIWFQLFLSNTNNLQTFIWLVNIFDINPNTLPLQINVDLDVMAIRRIVHSSAS